MDFVSIFSEYGAFTIIALILCSTAAGFIDSIVGGGGLIQLPGTFILFPKVPLPTLFGTNKIASLLGTASSAAQYSRRVKFDFKVLVPVAVCSGIASWLGARAVSNINPNMLKPLILIVLIVIAVYTFLKKDLGAVQTKQLTQQKQVLFGCLLAVLVGFYDGFFGPGTGSFFVMGFVFFLGFEFIKASAYAKLINCMTNLSALIVFIHKGNYILTIAILMAICNVTGNLIGTRLALKRGNAFVRIFFLMVVSLMILRYGYDILIKK